MRGISHNLPKTAGEEDDDATEYSLAGSSATGAVVGADPLMNGSLVRTPWDWECHGTKSQQEWDTGDPMPETNAIWAF